MWSELVVVFIDFVACKYDVLAIGGIDGQVLGWDISSCIMYRLPYLVQGLQAILNIGLANEFITNMLIMLPFMLKTRLVHNMAN